MRFNPIALTDHHKRWVGPVPAGAVCTHRKGCCDELVCATSHINPNYGVCIAGEGEHRAVPTQLVVPRDDAVVTTLTAEQAETEEAAAAEVIEAWQTAKDSRRSTRRSRCGMDKAGVPNGRRAQATVLTAHADG